MAFVNAMLAVTDPGDEVILVAPFYFNHDMAIVLAGCRTVAVSTDDRYQLRPDAIRAAITPRTRAVVTISPNNPSGAVYPEAALREVNALCATHGLYHVHDEAYEYFTYDGARHCSPGSIDGSAPHTISLFSLSKTYGMASWRVGYMVIPEHLFEAVNKIQDTNLICPPVVSQVVACAALGAGAAYCRERVGELAGVRLLVLDALAGVADRCTVPRPEGAFYCLARVHTSMDPLALVGRLIADHGVAVVPGTAFGLTDGCYVRVSVRRAGQGNRGRGDLPPGERPPHHRVGRRAVPADASRAAITPAEDHHRAHRGHGGFHNEGFDGARSGPKRRAGG